MADWDADSPQLRRNLAEVAAILVADARLRRMPSIDMARQWHETVMRGLDMPDPAYIGRFRGEHGLEDCHVTIGIKYGTEPSGVATALSEFESTLHNAITELDGSIKTAAGDQNELAAVLAVCAWAHAERVRIHPFANGNGRTARLWANFIAIRYGLPFFVTLRPRPGNDYGAAAQAAMDGDWEATEMVFRAMLREALAR